MAKLEELELCDLVEVVQTKKIFSQLAEDVFKRRYSTKIFDISGGFGVIPKKSVSVTHSHVYIENAEAAISVLCAFGFLIQRLSLNLSYLTVDERNKVGRFIENHMSESLNRVDYYGFDKDVLWVFTKPLKSVEIVNIQGKFKSSSPGTMQLNELFPSLRQLSLSNIDVFDPIVFDIQFPQLERFKISLLRSTAELSPYDSIRNFKLAVTNFLKNNPTIKSLTFKDCHSLEFMKMASDYLPNLEEITANFVALDEFEGEEMQFQNVKKVDFSWTSYNMTGMMLFDKLEDLKLSCLARECIEFAKQYKHVTKLDMFGKSFNDQDILAIGDILPNLVELNLGSDGYIEADPLIQMIDTCQHLEKVTLDFEKHFTTQFD